MASPLNSDGARLPLQPSPEVSVKLMHYRVYAPMPPAIHAMDRQINKMLRSGQYCALYSRPPKHPGHSPSSRRALSFRISGRTSSRNGAFSKSASQRSGVIAGQSEPNRTLREIKEFQYFTRISGKYFGDHPDRSI